MELEQLAPAAVAEFGGVLGRAYDVGHHDRREKALGGSAPTPHPRECARPRGQATRGGPAALTRGQRVRGNPRSILEVPGSGQREVTILARV